MADGGALNEYDEVLATARVRPNRADSRAAHQKVNNIQVQDVVSVVHHAPGREPQHTTRHELTGPTDRLRGFQ